MNRAAALLALCACLGSAFAQDEPAEEIRKLVKSLGVSDGDDRIYAEQRLTEIGEPAEPALQKLAADKDPERAARARRILEAISLAKLSRSIDVTQQARIALTGTAATGVAWSPDGQYLAGAGKSGTVTIWKAASGEVASRLRASGATSLAFSPSGKRLWVAGTAIFQYDLGTGAALLRVASLDASETDGPLSSWLQGSVDGRRVLIQESEAWAIRDGETGAVLQTLAKSGFGTSGALSSGGARAVVRAADSDTLRRFDAGNGRELDSVASGLEGTGPDHFYSTRPSTPTLAVWNDGRSAGLTGKGAVALGGRLLENSSGATGLSLSPDGTKLAVGLDSGVIRIWSEKGEKLAEHDLEGSMTRSLAWSPDGTSIAAACVDGRIRIFGRGARSLTLGGPLRPQACVLSRDGRRLAALDWGGCIALYDCRSAADEPSLYTWTTGHSIVPVGDADFLVRRPEGIVRIEGATGRKTALVWKDTGDEVRWWNASGDGSRLHLQLSSKSIMTRAGGEVLRELPGTTRASGWSLGDSRLGVLFGKELLILDAEGKDARLPTPLIFGYNVLDSVTWLPDGKTVHFRMGGKDHLFDVFAGTVTDVKELPMSWSAFGSLYAVWENHKTLGQRLAFTRTLGGKSAWLPEIRFMTDPLEAGYDFCTGWAASGSGHFAVWGDRLCTLYLVRQR